ncbi:MAG: hypothetical protein CM15mP78_07660 [Candidatus Poseidoniales archaeon]|nr:MAG: hypothetical protein CM15mP78_07660 [Candidatus Poseidoniales archaeon]
MDGQVEMTNPVDTSVGGMRGHILRRGVHLGMVGIPYLYFAHGETVAEVVGLDLQQVVAGVVLIALLLEGLALATWVNGLRPAGLRSPPGFSAGRGCGGCRFRAAF